MPLRRGRPIRTGSSVKRQTSWGPGPTGEVQMTGTSQSIFATAAQSNAAGLTLVRVRGELLVFMTSVTAALDSMNCAVGLCIVSDNAFDAGVASIPHPLTDIAWDGWLWYWTGFIEAVGEIVEANFTGNLGATAARIPIDSKAMRKFKQTDNLVGVVETVESGTIAVQFRLNCRTLVKLP